MTCHILIRLGLLGLLAVAIAQPTLTGCKAHRDWSGGITGWTCKSR